MNSSQNLLQSLWYIIEHVVHRKLDRKSNLNQFQTVLTSFPFEQNHSKFLSVYTKMNFQMLQNKNQMLIASLNRFKLKMAIMYRHDMAATVTLHTISDVTQKIKLQLIFVMLNYSIHQSIGNRGKNCIQILLAKTFFERTTITLERLNAA